MSLVDWDQELEIIAREIEQVRAAHGRTHLTGNKALMARKVAIIQKDMHIQRAFERIRKLTQKDFMLLPRERAMVHWASLYLESATKAFAAKTKLATRSLWIRLVRTRMASPGTDTEEAEQEDLVVLATRQANLARTESYLAEALAKLKEKKQTLTRRYHALGVVDANHSASGTLATRLGPTPEDALKSPTVRSLEAYFRLVTARVSAPRATRDFTASGSKVERKADGLMDLARTMVVGRLKDPTAKPPGRVLDKFQAALQQLDDLEAETREAYGQILGPESHEPRPIVVQNSPGRARTPPTT